MVFNGMNVLHATRFLKDEGGLRVQILSRLRTTGEYYIHNYMHMEAGSNDHIKENQLVEQGDIIGKAGSSNNVTLDQGMNYHLHLQLNRSTKEGVSGLELNLLEYFPELLKLPKQPGSKFEWPNSSLE
jgi:hypothetical protein